MPYTSTDSYLYLDAFFIGLKLDAWYEYSDDCINSLVYIADDKAYLSNNRTTYRAANESWISPILNLTLAIGTDVSDSLPNCFRFGQSVYDVESARYDTYSGIGSIIISFLFN